MLIVNKKKVFIRFVTLLIIIFFVFFIQTYIDHRNAPIMVMGGVYFQPLNSSESTNITISEDVETYFRPSKLPVLNDRKFRKLFDNYFDIEFSEITVPRELRNTPEDTILNYFSILREAANPDKGIRTGCGTLGQGKIPYPYAYQFLSTTYQKKLSYEQFLKTFKNILHINLIKYREIPVYANINNIIRYFVEIETIEGSEKGVGYFVYYYGFIDLIKEGNKYSISNIEFYGENYLCAPYHGWDYKAEYVVDIKYGYWCKLVKERYPTVEEDYVKNIYFSGTDGEDYRFVFFQLTNGTDIEIAQYIKTKDNSWKLIKLDPEKCLE